MGNTAADAEATMAANLREKTGRSLEEWVQIARDTQQEKHGQIVAVLKSEHGLTHGYANFIALKTLKSSALDQQSDDLVAGQYSGRKAGLRPIHDALIAAVSSFGDDVEIAPKKSYVSLRRAKQFGLIQPSTATRIDVGINLKNIPAAGRLESSGSFNSMVSHRVKVSEPDEVDTELIGWLRAAYDAAG